MRDGLGFFSESRYCAKIRDENNLGNSSHWSLLLGGRAHKQTILIGMSLSNGQSSEMFGRIAAVVYGKAVPKVNYSQTSQWL